MPLTLEDIAAIKCLKCLGWRCCQGCTWLLSRHSSADQAQYGAQLPSAVIIMTDSECTISTLDTSTRALHPFMHKHVGEVQENNAKMRKFFLLCSIQGGSKKSSHFRFVNFSPSWWTRIKSKDIFVKPCPCWIQKCPYFCKSLKIWVIGGQKCVGLSYFLVIYS